jgi:hypothetical protein
MGDLCAYFRKYVRISEEAYSILPPWVLHTHAFSAFARTPYLHVTSPAIECGKTTLLEITELVVPHALQAAGVSEGVLARTIDLDHPVLLLDELDEQQKMNKELVAAIMATINSGYKRSGCRVVLIAKGKEWEPKRLSTFCPKMLASIGNLPAAAASRSIPIRMERLAPGESVAEIDEYITEPEARDLFDRAQAWADLYQAGLRDARPICPGDLRNRKREVSRPLLAIADACGGEWPQRVRKALVNLFGAAQVNVEQPITVQLLADIKAVFTEKEVSKMSSDELAAELGMIEDSPWPEFSKGNKPLTQNRLASLLKPFKIFPKGVRLGSKTPKGYHQDQFTDAWARYLAQPPTQTATPPQINIHAGLSDISRVQHNPDVALQKSEESPVNTRVVADVALPNGGRAKRELKYVQEPDWDTTTPDDYEAQERAAIQEFEA